MSRRGKDMDKLKNVIALLLDELPLPPSCKDHQLKGDLAEYRGCHIEPNWVLIYAIKGAELYLSRTGTHSDILE
jgi:mRNA interferase YafQ